MMPMTVVLLFALTAPLRAAGDAKSPPAPASAPARKTAAKAAASALPTDVEKTLYALGMSLGGRLTVLSLTSADLKSVEMGLRDAALGKASQVDMQLYAPKINELARTRIEAKAEKEKVRSKSFQEKAAKEPGAEVLPSGLIYKELKAGSGEAPKSTDTVKVHYHGTLIDGKVFDSSILRGQPAEFPVNRVVPCWTEALQKMRVGGKARLVCPSKIAYGDMGSPPDIPGGATLVFEVELLGLVNSPASD